MNCPFISPNSPFSNCGLSCGKALRSHPTSTAQNNGTSILHNDVNRNTFKTRRLYGILQVRQDLNELEKPHAGVGPL